MCLCNPEAGQHEPAMSADHQNQYQLIKPLMINLYIFGVCVCVCVHVCVCVAVVCVSMCLCDPEAGQHGPAMSADHHNQYQLIKPLMINLYMFGVCVCACVYDCVYMCLCDPEAGQHGPAVSTDHQNQYQLIKLLMINLYMFGVCVCVCMCICMCVLLSVCVCVCVTQKQGNMDQQCLQTIRTTRGNTICADCGTPSESLHLTAS